MTCTLKLLFIYTFVVSKVNGEWKLEEYSTNNFHTCVNHVIGHIFTEDETLLIVSSRNGYYPKFVTNPRILLSTAKFRSFKRFRDFKIGIVMNMNGTENITENIKNLLKTELIKSNPGAKVKWVIVTPDRSTIENYFLEFWKSGINNLVVLLYGSNNPNSFPQIYMSDPQAVPNNCGKALNLLSKQPCNSNITIEFPQVLRKYTNCTFRYLTTSALNGTSKQIVHIVSHFVMNEITNHLNSDFKYDGQIEHRPFLIYAFPYRELTTESITPIFYSPKVIWAVPKATKIPLVLVIKILFKKTVWALIAFSFFTTAIIWWLILKYKNIECDFSLILLSVWETTLFGFVSRLPVFWASRLLFLSYTLYCIHTQAVFSSKIVEILTIPQYERNIKNLDDLAESNLKIIMDTYTKYSFGDLFDVNDTHRYHKMYQSIHDVFGDNLADEFFNCLRQKQCAAFFSGTEEYLNVTFFEISHTFEDNSAIGSIAYALGTERCNYMSLTFNKMVYNLVESGIVDNFAMKIDKYGVVSLDEPEPLPLTVDELYIVFVFWSVCLTISVCIFIAEILVKHFNHY